MCPTFAVTYDINDGIGTTPRGQTICAGNSITLARNNGFIRVGYTFGGWNTEFDGTGDNYVIFSLFTPTDSVVLYANWLLNAEMPVITVHPQRATYDHEAKDVQSLVVEATIGDEGVLNYQWFVSTTPNIGSGVAIEGAEDAYYYPSTDKVGTFFYYVEVTNINEHVPGVQTATIVSRLAMIEVLPIVDAEEPYITSQPRGAIYRQGETAAVLTVTAHVVDGGTRSFQWYRHTEYDTVGAELISGATGSGYLPSTDEIGTMFYFVVITNTNPNANGVQVVTTTSEIVAITVNQVTNAEIPVIADHPEGDTYNQHEEATALVVTVKNLEEEGGALSYQWFVSTTLSNQGGDSIIGATGSTFTPSTKEAGTFYYYVTVINTNIAANGYQTGTAVSQVATVVVRPTVNAVVPILSTHPQSATHNHRAITTLLTVSATAHDGGTLSYQWYRNKEDNTETGTAISGATGESYSPSTEEVSVWHYYVIVTNTNPTVNGDTIAVATSAIATITVIDLVNAREPEIVVHPQSVNYKLDDLVKPLIVEAKITDGGTLSYQWYVSTTPGTAGGTLLVGATNSSYTPNISELGTLHYYVMVVNTNSGVSGLQSAFLISEVATVVVSTTVDAQMPIVTTNPIGETYYHHATADLLRVAAHVTDGGTLTYQWYADGKIIKDATGESYRPSTAEVGTISYHVKITNINRNVNGVDSVVVFSDIIDITVKIAPVTAIINVPSVATQGIPLTLTGTVVPSYATNQTIIWRIEDNGGIDVEIIDTNLFLATELGKVKVSATITNGKGENNDYTVEFDIDVVDLINAQLPNIADHPQSAEVPVTETASTRLLTVIATVSDDGVLTYQWQIETSPDEWENVLNATNPAFFAPIDKVGTFKYRVLVTNTIGIEDIEDPENIGHTTATAVSNTATITVKPIEDAKPPTITFEPVVRTYVQGESATPLSVMATGDGGTLTYQWYTHTTNLNTGGIRIPGATGTNYTPLTSTAGTMYYYVIVTNTNNSVTGNPIATTTSGVATIEVATPVNAQTPNITGQPVGVTYIEGRTANALTVMVNVTDEGTLSYQWFSNTINSPIGGTAIPIQFTTHLHLQPKRLEQLTTT